MAYRALLHYVPALLVSLSLWWLIPQAVGVL